MSVPRLAVDWEAVAGVVPPLRHPVLTDTGTVTVRWPESGPLHPDSHLGAAVLLHAGLNDLEFGADRQPARA